MKIRPREYDNPSRSHSPFNSSNVNPYNQAKQTVQPLGGTSERFETFNRKETMDTSMPQSHQYHTSNPYSRIGSNTGPRIKTRVAAAIDSSVRLNRESNNLS